MLRPFRPLWRHAPRAPRHRARTKNTNHTKASHFSRSDTTNNGIDAAVGRLLGARDDPSEMRAATARFDPLHHAAAMRTYDLRAGPDPHRRGGDAPRRKMPRNPLEPRVSADHRAERDGENAALRRLLNSSATHKQGKKPRGDGSEDDDETQSDGGLYAQARRFLQESQGVQGRHRPGGGDPHDVAAALRLRRSTNTCDVDSRKRRAAVARTRTQKRLREAKRHDGTAATAAVATAGRGVGRVAADAQRHPCLLQDPSGACPDPACCPFVRFPARTCLAELKYGRCRDHERDGSCPWDHVAGGTRQFTGVGATSSTSDVASGFPGSTSANLQQIRGHSPLIDTVVLAIVSLLQLRGEGRGSRGGDSIPTPDALRVAREVIHCKLALQPEFRDAFMQQLAVGAENSHHDDDGAGGGGHGGGDDPIVHLSGDNAVTEQNGDTPAAAAASRTGGAASTAAPAQEEFDELIDEILRDDDNNDELSVQFGGPPSHPLSPNDVEGRYAAELQKPLDALLASPVMARASASEDSAAEEIDSAVADHAQSVLEAVLRAHPSLLVRSSGNFDRVIICPAIAALLVESNAAAAAGDDENAGTRNVTGDVEPVAEELSQLKDELYTEAARAAFDLVTGDAATSGEPPLFDVYNSVLLWGIRTLHLPPEGSVRGTATSVLPAVRAISGALVWLRSHPECAHALGLQVAAWFVGEVTGNSAAARDGSSGSCSSSSANAAGAAAAARRAQQHVWIIRSRHRALAAALQSGEFDGALAALASRLDASLSRAELFALEWDAWLVVVESALLGSNAASARAADLLSIQPTIMALSRMVGRLLERHQPLVAKERGVWTFERLQEEADAAGGSPAGANADLRGSPAVSPVAGLMGRGSRYRSCWTARLALAGEPATLLVFQGAVSAAFVCRCLNAVLLHVSTFAAELRHLLPPRLAQACRVQMPLAAVLRAQYAALAELQVLGKETAAVVDAVRQFEQQHLQHASRAVEAESGADGIAPLSAASLPWRDISVLLRLLPPITAAVSGLCTALFLRALHLHRPHAAAKRAISIIDSHNHLTKALVLPDPIHYQQHKRHFKRVREKLTGKRRIVSRVVAIDRTRDFAKEVLNAADETLTRAKFTLLFHVSADAVRVMLELFADLAPANGRRLWTAVAAGRINNFALLSLDCEPLLLLRFPGAPADALPRAASIPAVTARGLPSQVGDAVVHVAPDSATVAIVAQRLCENETDLLALARQMLVEPRMRAAGVAAKFAAARGVAASLVQRAPQSSLALLAGVVEHASDHVADAGNAPHAIEALLAEALSGSVRPRDRMPRAWRVVGAELTRVFQLSMAVPRTPSEVARHSQPGAELVVQLLAAMIGSATGEKWIAIFGRELVEAVTNVRGASQLGGYAAGVVVPPHVLALLRRRETLALWRHVALACIGDQGSESAHARARSNFLTELTPALTTLAGAFVSSAMLFEPIGNVSSDGSDDGGGGAIGAARQRAGLVHCRTLWACLQFCAPRSATGSGSNSGSRSSTTTDQRSSVSKAYADDGAGHAHLRCGTQLTVYVKPLVGRERAIAAAVWGFACASAAAQFHLDDVASVAECMQVLLAPRVTLQAVFDEVVHSLASWGTRSSADRREIVASFVAAAALSRPLGLPPKVIQTAVLLVERLGAPSDSVAALDAAISWCCREDAAARRGDGADEDDVEAALTTATRMLLTAMRGRRAPSMSAGVMGTDEQVWEDVAAWATELHVGMRSVSG